MRRILFLLAALSLAGGTAWYSKRMLDRAQLAAATVTQREPVRFKEVLVATGPVTVGEFVRPESFRWQAWPDVEVPATFFVKGERDPVDLEGAVARRPLDTGEPVTEAALVKPGERGFLAAVLAPGMRAISVPVDDASSNAGLIYPGDHVDLLLSQTLTATNDSASARRVAETVLEDVRVLAMGRRIKPHEDPDLSSAGTQIRTVTLEVTPEGAEAVALVTDLGRLSISLRSLATPAEMAAPRTAAAARRLTWDADVAKALKVETDNLTIFRGKDASTVDLRTGALP
jgi:pilus assembly protein CpaB